MVVSPNNTSCGVQGLAGLGGIDSCLRVWNSKNVQGGAVCQFAVIAFDYVVVDAVGNGGFSMADALRNCFKYASVMERCDNDSVAVKPKLNATSAASSWESLPAMSLES